MKRLIAAAFSAAPLSCAPLQPTTTQTSGASCISLASVGGRRVIVIPSDLAYGPTGSGPIGPDEALVFVVDLKDVSSP